MTDTIAEQYTVARLCRDNLSDLAILHREVYGRAVALDFFYKKYDTAFTGVEYVGVIAYNARKEPVGFYGVIPCFLAFNGKKYLSAQSADTMTHPRHRFKGMFVDLSNRTFALCREAGINLVFGFPNQNSYHGAVNKLGWHQADTMSCFIIPVKAAALARLCNRFRFLSWIYKPYCRAVLKGYRLNEKGITNSAAKDGFAGIYRDDAFLQYKTYGETIVISVAGVKCWLALKHHLMIGDFENLSGEHIDKVMQHLAAIASRLGKTELQFHCSTGTFLYNLFKAHYPEQPSYPVLFQDFGSAIPPEKVKFTFADIDIF